MNYSNGLHENGAPCESRIWSEVKRNFGYSGEYTNISMQIFVKMNNTKLLVLDVLNTDTIKSVKQKIFNLVHFSMYRQRLIYSGKFLEDHRTLQDYNV